MAILKLGENKMDLGSARNKSSLRSSLRSSLTNDEAVGVSERVRGSVGAWRAWSVEAWERGGPEALSLTVKLQPLELTSHESATVAPM